MCLGPACLRALSTTDDVRLGRRPTPREEPDMPGKACQVTSEVRAVDEHYKYSLLRYLRYLWDPPRDPRGTSSTVPLCGL